MDETSLKIVAQYSVIKLIVVRISYEKVKCIQRTTIFSIFQDFCLSYLVSQCHRSLMHESGDIQDVLNVSYNQLVYLMIFTKLKFYHVFLYKMTNTT